MGRFGYELDREGLAIYRNEDGHGYLVSVDQIPGRSALKFYPRSGSREDPLDQNQLVHEVQTTADSTDGLEVTSTPLPGFPKGLAVMMNEAGRNFLIFDWSAIGPKR
jgi:3-phytase